MNTYAHVCFLYQPEEPLLSRHASFKFHFISLFTWVKDGMLDPIKLCVIKHERNSGLFRKEMVILVQSPAMSYDKCIIMNTCWDAHPPPPPLVISTNPHLLIISYFPAVIHPTLPHSLAPPRGWDRWLSGEYGEEKWKKYVCVCVGGLNVRGYCLMEKGWDSFWMQRWSNDMGKMLERRQKGEQGSRKGMLMQVRDYVQYGAM